MYMYMYTGCIYMHVNIYRDIYIIPNIYIYIRNCISIPKARAIHIYRSYAYQNQYAST